MKRQKFAPTHNGTKAKHNQMYISVHREKIRKVGFELKESSESSAVCYSEGVTEYPLDKRKHSFVGKPEVCIFCGKAVFCFLKSSLHTLPVIISVFNHFLFNFLA